MLLGMGGSIVADEIIYFAPSNLPGFFQYNKITGKLGLLPIKETKRKEIYPVIYVGMCTLHDKIIFLPYYASELLVYDMKYKKEVNRIHLKSKLPKSSQWYRFYIHAVPYLNFVYCIGWHDSEMLCFNIETEKISVVNTWKKAIAEVVGNTSFIGIHAYDVCVVEGNLWAPIHTRDCILEFNLQTMEARVHRVGMPDMKFATICFDGTDFWLTGDKKRIVKWNKNTKEASYIGQFPKGFIKSSKEEKDYFYKSYYESGIVYFFPMFANMALKVDVGICKTDIFYQWDKLLACNVVQKWDENTFYVEWCCEGSAKIEHSMIIDVDGCILNEDVMEIDIDELEWPEYIDDDALYHEDEIMTLNRFLDKRACTGVKDKCDRCDSAGKKIYLEGKNIG